MNSVISGFYSSSINLIILFLMLACILICLCSHVLTKILCYILFFCGVSTPFRVMASPYGTSRLHSLDTSHSVGLWRIDQPEAETSTWQRTTLTRDKYSCPRRDSNPQFQQANSRIPTPIIFFFQFRFYLQVFIPFTYNWMELYFISILKRVLVFRYMKSLSNWNTRVVTSSDLTLNWRGLDRRLKLVTESLSDSEQC